MIGAITTEDLIELSTTQSGLGRAQWLVTLGEIRAVNSTPELDIARALAQPRHEVMGMKKDLKDLKGHGVFVLFGVIGLGVALAKFPPATVVRAVRDVAKKLGA